MINTGYQGRYVRGGTQALRRGKLDKNRYTVGQAVSRSTSQKTSNKA